MGVASGSNFNLGGSLTYNGYTFVPPRFSFKVRMVPRRSDDRRTNISNTYQFNVRAIISDDASSQTRSHLQFTGQDTGGAAYQTQQALQNDTWQARHNLQNIRSILSQPGCRLQIVGMGWDLDLNSGASTSIFDSDYGPHTLSLEFAQLGNGVLWEMLWVFEITLPECPAPLGDGTIFQSAKTGQDYDKSYIRWPYVARGATQMALFEQLSFSTQYTISPSGLTTRVIQGMFSIPLNRADVLGLGAHNEIIATADELWDSINPDVPVGFQRMNRVRDLSPDMRHLRFQIVDQELPSENDLPVGVVDIQVDHHVQLSGKIVSGPMNVGCILSGYIEVAKGFSKAEAFNKIILILQQRIDWAKAAWVLNYGTPPVGSIPVYLNGVTITESLYGPRRIQFAFPYLIVGGTSPNQLYLDLVGQTGLFQPVNVPGVSWTDWSGGFHRSNSGGDWVGVWDSRGISHLEFTPENAPIVGPCDNNPSASTVQPQDIPSTASSSAAYINGCPPSGFDYLLWKCRLHTGSSPDFIVHSPMTKYSASSSASSAAIFSQEGYLKSYDGEVYFPNTIYANPDSPVQPNMPRAQRVRAVSIMKFCITGKGVRLGKPVELPSLVNDSVLYSLLGSAQIVPDGQPEKWSQRVGTLSNCPVFAGRFKVCYKIVGAVSQSQIAQIFDYLQGILGNTPTDSSGVKLGGFYGSSSSTYMV